MSPARRPPSTGRLSADEIVSPAGPNVPFPPQEALLVETIPSGANVWYEPKWDGFRGVLENDGGELGLWSRNGRPLLRYFPELRALGEKLPPHSALDGEIIIEQEGRLEFDLMQMRLHPAESRIRKLSVETPARFIAFDVLLWNGEPVHTRPLAERRAFLEANVSGFSLSEITRDVAKAKFWLERLEVLGLDGIVAKRADLPYMPGSRDAVQKVKHHRTVDCVIVGYRTSGKRIATLLLGLYRDDGTLDFVGHTSGIPMALEKELQKILPPMIEEEGTFAKQFASMEIEGRVPGAGSRWSGGKDLPWHEIRPELVCEVRFDKMEGERFRHGTRFMRFRPDKEPKQCTWAQLDATRHSGDPDLADLLRPAG
ncbi:MAG TPA: ATP-dependent DNA ligase [Candidatus Limnocylindrales bacterium]|nr:ATP-dependent DNA ligase [Candidatus Limnocylindrales bacterium]